ncbi:MAG: hypothetical protein HY236_03305 [Acidobacteria bacterium]|nr:hypothetical protein [Acidobacteriota bacterium]
MTSRIPVEAAAAVAGVFSPPTPWRFTPREIAVRLFLTCWLVYVLHFASNVVREVYPALAIGDHLSFRVDDYAHMHSDLFETPGRGWHIGNNPGASMLAAIPYALSRPVIDRIVERVNRQRQAEGLTAPPAYNSPWPMAREFFREAWRRGYDVKFGLAAFVMQSLCMAPSSALGVVVMFYALRHVFGSDRKALWLALLYAFGTPVFFRTGYLNQNLMLGHWAFLGFIAMWNPGDGLDWSARKRYFLGGLAGGTALLFDYSGAVLLLSLFCYGIVRSLRAAGLREAMHHGGWYVLGTLGPVGLLWFYQWQSFGHPFYPGQHWMPPVEWSNLGYQGYGWPQLELFLGLAFDYRFGFFVSSPLMLLALLAPLLFRHANRVLPRQEMWMMLATFLACWLFFSGSNYTRLQFNTGVRYMSAMFPFLFLPAAVVLERLPRLAVYSVAVISVAESWCLAMYRDVERGLGVLDPILHVFSGGFQLPFLTVLYRTGGQYGEYFSGGVSPLPLFALTAAILYGIWSPRWGSAGGNP